MAITKDAWLKALDEAQIDRRHDPDSIAVPEYMALFGVTRHRAQTELKALVRAKKAAVTRKLIAGTDGRQVRVTSYKLVKR